MTIIEYVTEEVSRQGHDVTVPEGLERVRWMLEAWEYAMRRPGESPALIDAITLGKVIERYKNADGIRSVGVRVGLDICPPPETILRSLTLLFEQRDALKPIEFYKEFELIHPFVDGNGRTGKVLLNWLNGTLSNPIFPPADLFGKPILNP